MTIDEAIQTLIAIERYPTSIKGKDCACEMAIKALEEKREREANEPLTIEELREIYKKDIPIYVKFSEEIYPAILDRYEHNLVAVWCAMEHPDFLYEENYGKTWFAYKYRPDE